MKTFKRLVTVLLWVLAAVAVGYLVFTFKRL